MTATQTAPCAKGGPRTEEGKRASSRNSTKHGLFAQSIDAFDPEDHAEYAELLRDYRAHFQPANVVEADLVQQIAFNRFRHNRFIRLEALAFDAPGDDCAAFDALTTNLRTFDYLRRALDSLDRAYHRTLRVLDQHRKDNKTQALTSARPLETENVKTNSPFPPAPVEDTAKPLPPVPPVPAFLPASPLASHANLR